MNNSNLSKTKKIIIVIFILLITSLGTSFIFKKLNLEKPQVPTVKEKENIKIETKKEDVKSLEEKIKNNIKKSQENTKKQLEDSKKDGEINM